MPFVDVTATPANCVSNGVAVRATATRLWLGRIEPDAGARAHAQSVIARVAGVPGRVESGGAFEDARLEAVLRAALPVEVAAALRPRFEWYACRGAFFHNDAHFEAVLFGVWCLAGPPRDLVFPRLDERVALAVGLAAIFDPFEPHAVLNPGQARYERAVYEGAPVSVFLGFELALDAATRSAFRIGAPILGAPALSSRAPVHPETGAVP